MDLIIHAINQTHIIHKLRAKSANCHCDSLLLNDFHYILYENTRNLQ